MKKIFWIFIFISIVCGFIFYALLPVKNEYGRPTFKEVRQICEIENAPNISTKNVWDTWKISKPFIQMNLKTVIELNQLMQNIERTNATQQFFEVKKFNDQIDIFKKGSNYGKTVELWIDGNDHVSVLIMDLYDVDFKHYVHDEFLKKLTQHLITLVNQDIQSEQIYSELIQQYQQQVQSKSYDSENGFVSVSVVSHGLRFNLSGSNRQFVNEKLGKVDGKDFFIVDCKSRSYVAFPESVIFSISKL